MNPARWHPVETRDVEWGDGLGAYIRDGVGWFFIDGEWQALSPESWAWRFQRSGYGMRLWVPQILLCKRGNASSFVSRSNPHPDVNFNTAQRERANCVTLVFNFLQSAGEDHLLKTCRLVCRGWAWRYAWCICPSAALSVDHQSSSTNQAFWDPALTRDVTYKDGLVALVDHGVVWFHIDGEWQTLSSELWSWRFLQYDGEARIWAPQVLISSRSESHLNLNFKTVQRERTNYITPIFDYLLNVGQHHLLKTCSLVCRGWAWYYARCICPSSALSVDCRPGSMNPGFWDPTLTRNVTYRDGLAAIVDQSTVWFHIDGEWQTLYHVLWAWRFQRGDYGMRIWVPQRLSYSEMQKYHTVTSPYQLLWLDCEVTNLPVVAPFFKYLARIGDSQLLRFGRWNEERWTSKIVTTRFSASQWKQICIQPGLPTSPDARRRDAATTIIAPWLLGYIHENSDRALCRLYRSVCRDWAARFPATPLDLGGFKIRMNSVLYRVDGEWQYPHWKIWAWFLVDCSTDWWMYRGRRQWIPKLLHPIDRAVHISCIKPAPSMLGSTAVLSPTAQLYRRRQMALQVVTIIRPLLVEHIQRTRDSELCQGYRYIYRDWAEEYPHAFLEVGTFEVRGETVVFCIGDEWWYPAKSLWAWSIAKKPECSPSLLSYMPFRGPSYEWLPNLLVRSNGRSQSVYTVRPAVLSTHPPPTSSLPGARQLHTQ